MIIDSHAHVLSTREAEQLIEKMQRAKIDKALVIFIPPGVHPTVTTPYEEFAAAIAPYKNLYPVGSMKMTNNPQFDADFAALKNQIEKKEIYGVKFYLGYEHFYANDPKCDAIYALCEENSMPVIFHTGDTWAHPEALVRYANPIYIDDVAVKYPTLRIVIAHAGNPCWTKECAELLYKNPHVYADLAGLYIDEDAPQHPIAKRYKDYVRDNILEMAAYIGTPRKFLFGSDFTLADPGEYAMFVRDMLKDVCTEEDFEYIFYKNVQELFHL